MSFLLMLTLSKKLPANLCHMIHPQIIHPLIAQIYADFFSRTLFVVNVQHVVMESYILQRAPESSPSHETHALKFRARLDFLRLQ